MPSGRLLVFFAVIFLWRAFLGAGVHALFRRKILSCPDHQSR